jgi:hypothetical protein
MTNIAGDPDHEEIRKDFHDRLMKILVEQNDPRVTEKPPRFEYPTYVGPVAEEWKQENANGCRIPGHTSIISSKK